MADHVMTARRWATAPFTTFREHNPMRSILLTPALPLIYAVSMVYWPLASEFRLT